MITRLLDQRGIGEGQSGCKQRALDDLPAPGFAALDQRSERPERAMQRRSEIDPVDRGPVRRIAGARHVHRTRHDLPDAVEADAVGPGPRPAERGCRRQDDVRLDRLERVVVELHRAQGLRRQIGDDHVRGRNQAAHHLLPFRLHRIEREALLVAIDLKKQRAFATLSHRRHEAILAAVALLHANDLGAEFGQQGRAIRPCDIAPEIENAYARQNSPHPFLPGVLTSGFGQITGTGRHGKVATDVMPCLKMSSVRRFGWRKLRALDSYFDAFSLREPVSTSLENALV
ncbi:hypothetical protein ACVWYI_002767 [Bradyrhizobium sp. LB13.1]